MAAPRAEMELLNTSPFEVGWLSWEPNAGRPAITVVVKATYALPATGQATLLDEQPCVSGDVYVEDDIEKSLAWPNDLELLKPCGEVLVVGSVRLREPVTQTIAAFRVGELGKRLAVFGDRVWKGVGASEPAPFKAMPLGWERAFGGPSLADNPIGRGLERDADTGSFRLPNLENPDALLGGSDQRPAPASLAPVPRTWKARMRFAGTYNDAWLQSRYPGLADDVDYRLFLASPEDQRVQGFFRGDEEVEVRNLHPEHPQVRATLPGDVAVAFLVKQGARTDVGLRLDTMVIDADAGTVTCLWRGVTEVTDLDSVDHLFVLRAEVGIDYAAAYAAAIAPDPEEEAETVDAPAPAPPIEPSGAIVGEAPGAVVGEAPGAKWAHLDQAMTVQGDDSALSSSLADELARRREEEKSRAFRPVFDDALGLGDQGAPPDELTPEERLAIEMADALGDMPDAEEANRRREVRDAVAKGESCAGWDLAGVDLSGLDLSGGDFRGANLSRANLSGAHLRGSVLEEATLVGAELSRAIFQDVSFADADLSPVRAEGVRFTDCRFDRVSARESYLRGSRFLRWRVAETKGVRRA